MPFFNPDAIERTPDVREGSDIHERDLQFSEDAIKWFEDLMDKDIGELDFEQDLNHELTHERDHDLNCDLSRDIAHELERTSRDVPDELEGEKKNLTRLPSTGGEWSGERGNSTWKPDRDIIPGDRNGTNPENKTWGEIIDTFENDTGKKFDGVDFKDGKPDFSKVSRGDVKIDEFSADRDENFDYANQELAKQRGCSPKDVERWMKSNKYTWHECDSEGHMQKVPTEIHGNIPHYGGVAECKSAANA